MLRLVHLDALVAILAIGCGHTVGATEVARRAAVELDCGASHTYVHTIARNHYAAAACGKRAIYMHALYIEHTFSSTPWEDLTDTPPASPPAPLR